MEEKNKFIKPLIISILIVLLIIGGYFTYNKLTSKKPDEKKDTEVVSKITPLLYEVTKSGSNNKMYLFGSIHAAMPSDLVYPEYVLNAYNNSHYIACEANIYSYQQDIDAQMELALKLRYMDGTTIKDHLNSETYNKIVNFLNEKGAYTEAYDYYVPYYMYSLVNQFMANDAKLNSNSGVDINILRKATEDKKTIIEIESLNYQLDIFLGLSDELYDIMFTELLDNYDDNVKALTGLYNAWKTGNERQLILYSGDEIKESDSYTKEQLAEIRNFNDTLLKNRNNTMTQKAIEYFNNNQDVFFMVGTLHIVGGNGLVKQLENNGFTVKQVK